MYSLSIIPLIIPGVIAPGISGVGNNAIKKTIDQYNYQCQDSTWNGQLPIVWDPRNRGDSKTYDKYRGKDTECISCAKVMTNNGINCVTKCHTSFNHRRNECAERGRPIVREHILEGCPPGESREECGMYLHQ